MLFQCRKAIQRTKDLVSSGIFCLKQLEQFSFLPRVKINKLNLRCVPIDKLPFRR